jgi:hypothetical protein
MGKKNESLTSKILLALGRRMFPSDSQGKQVDRELKRITRDKRGEKR